MCDISGSVLSLSDDDDDDDDEVIDLCVEFDVMEFRSIFLVVPNILGDLFRLITKNLEKDKKGFE